MTAPPLVSYLAIAPQSPEEAVLRLLIELGAQVVGAQEGSLLVLDPGRKDLVFAMTVGASERTLLGKRVPLGEGLTGLAALTQEVQVAAPTFKLSQTDGAPPEGEPVAVMAAPMLAGDTLLGVITAVRFEGSRFSSQDARLYARLASVAGLVVHQRQRLAAFEDAQAGGAANESERQVVAAAARLARVHPEACDHVAHLLAAVEALAAPGRG